MNNHCGRIREGPGALRSQALKSGKHWRVDRSKKILSPYFPTRQPRFFQQSERWFVQPNNSLIFKVLKTPPDALGTDLLGKLMLLTLLDYWNPRRTGATVWPSMARLAYQTGMSERTARSCVRGLENAGLIKTERSLGRTSNRYALHTEVIHRLCNPAPYAALEGANPAGDSGSTRQNLHSNPAGAAAERLINALPNSLRRSNTVSANGETLADVVSKTAERLKVEQRKRE